MTVRRTIVWSLSVLVGAVTAFGAILFFDTTLQKFSIANLILVWVSIGAFTFIWLDYFLKTKYLKD